ncbi:MAG TPA: DUF1176 domain-containing protein, partial [Burkholderiaceae bacterium]|nr:DUF1176 domain-containing protein [Burkholderiaceae bacterium]
MRRGLASLLLALAGAAQAAGTTAVASPGKPFKPFVQRFGDWTVACDNIRACSAQGYKVEDENGAQAGLWLSRSAGPEGVLSAQLHLSGPDSPELPEGTLAELHIGQRRFSRLPLDAELPPATIRALVNALIEAAQMQVKAAGS